LQRLIRRARDYQIGGKAARTASSLAAAPNFEFAYTGPHVNGERESAVRAVAVLSNHEEKCRELPGSDKRG